VAGSDPCGGAGLQADLKAMTVAGVYGAAAPTAITVQNSRGVKEVHPVEARLLMAQVTAVLDDLKVGAIKTGMMGSAENGRELAGLLAEFAGPVVCDPVIQASDSTDLCRDPDLAATRELIGQATCITPNRKELELLTGGEAKTPAEAVELISLLFDQFPRLEAVALKGGHFCEHEKTVCDHLYLRDESGKAVEAVRAERPRLASSPHGTGCVFASTLAAFLARDFGIVPAFGEASRLMDQFLQKTFTPSDGTSLIWIAP